MQCFILSGNIKMSEGNSTMNIQLMLLIVFLFQKVICTSDEKVLEELQKDFFDYLLSENPEFATRNGDKRFDDKVDDLSLETFDRWKNKVEEVLKKLKRISRDNLTDQHKTDYDIFNSYLHTYLDGYKWRMYSALAPIMLLAQPSSLSTRMANRLTVTSDKQDFDNFIKRIQKYPTQFAQIKGRMQKAIELKRTLHRVSIEGWPAVIDSMTLGQKPEDCFLYKPFDGILDHITSIAEDDKVTLRAQAKSAIEQYVMAVRDLRDFISNTYMRNTRPGLGVNTWDNGENYYKETIIHQLSVNLTAEEIYNIGVKEVERISGELKKIFSKMGIDGNIKESFKVLNSDKQYFLETGDAMVDKYNDVIHHQIEPELSKLFKNRPNIPVVVKPTRFDGMRAFYSTPPVNGPGIFNLNTFHPYESAWYNFMAIALHETNPGHHLQITTAKVSDIPQLRRERFTNLYYQIPTAFPTWNAYTEGWGLYAEYLGEEMGLYKSDVEKLGRYSLEIFRACRLVVDTGLHHYNWTRNQAMEYLSNYTSLGENTISYEVNRYVSIPGQALSYKIGEMKFKELRKKSEDMLGEHFDIRDFHNTILQNGPMSFSNLEKVLDRWIDTVKATTNAARLNSISFLVSILPLMMVLLGM